MPPRRSESAPRVLRRSVNQWHRVPMLETRCHSYRDERVLEDDIEVPRRGRIGSRVISGIGRRRLPIGSGRIAGTQVTLLHQTAPPRIPEHRCSRGACDGLADGFEQCCHRPTTAVAIGCPSPSDPSSPTAHRRGGSSAAPSDDLPVHRPTCSLACVIARRDTIAKKRSRPTRGEPRSKNLANWDQPRRRRAPNSARPARARPPGPGTLRP